MLIKVCGLRDKDNIRQVESLGVDMVGLIFWPKSPRYVPVSTSVSTNLLFKDQNQSSAVQKVGVFVDELPQNIIARVYQHHLDYVQLHGEESPVLIENLKRTLMPEISQKVKFIKALSIREADDVKRWRQYEGYADILLFDTKCKCVGGSGEQFDWSVLESYDGNIPFLLSGGIGPEDTERVLNFHHPMLAGIDLNSRFEVAPALKDVEKLHSFINKIKGI